MSSVHTLIPTFEEDLFAPQALENPFPLYRRVRDLGPVVKLAHSDVYALGRFVEVQTALRTPDILVSGEGVGFNPIINEKRREPDIIASDGVRHRKLRQVLGKPLMPKALNELREELRASISKQIGVVRAAGWVDGIQALAQHLPVTAISFLVGLPEEGRQNMLRWAAAAFNLVGTRVEDLADDVAALREFRHYLLDVDPARLREGSWAKSLFDAAASGKLAVGEARAALSGLVLPSLDTTIFAQGCLLYNLGTCADQWTLLKHNRQLIRGAIIENVRHSAVVRWFSRVAIADWRVGDVEVPAGARIMLMYASANRDERHYPDPDRYDVTRDADDQLGWGTGPHMCAGMHLAKLEMELLLEALLDQVENVEVGTPVISRNQGLYGILQLPVRLR